MVVVVILFFAVMGVIGLFSPSTVLELTGTPGGSPFARNEVRAVYGGAGLAVAFLLSASFWMDGGEMIRWTLGVWLFGMGAARAAGLIVDWPKMSLAVVYCVLELGGAAVLLS